MNPITDLTIRQTRLQTRRHFLRNCQVGLGGMALASLAGPGTGLAEEVISGRIPAAAKAKQVIYLHMAGSPSQHETLDYKPVLAKWHMKPCPDELMADRSFPFIKGRPKLLGPQYEFQQHGESGAWISSLFPKLAGHADKLCVVNSMFTDQFNHAPAQLFLHTGTPQFGGAAMGSWITYGLGNENENLPGFMVMVSGGKLPSGGKQLWGSGFLPGVYQGVQCRSGAEPILFVNNPPGMSRDIRRSSLDALNQLNRLESKAFGDPETATRIGQYELAFRMQTAVPEVMDITQETPETLELYGAQPGAGSFANNCLLARRLVEQGVRFVQLFDWGWDVHGTNPGDDLMTQLPKKCQQVDQPISALLTDLERRGLLKETLVIWGGEFGRTAMNEARNGSKLLGRDHHPDCFSIWMAGGGIKPGTRYGETDDFGYTITQDPVGVRDLQATILHLLGKDPYQFSFPFQGLDQRLIGPANDPRVIQGLLA
ncbi:MAG: DUF1501 domain-containing protein [Planctomycetaceae bacterium]|nr:DUF1501 domain-containing protein [Planctomycetaceae bacterium]MCP4461748.1 DUF1501 domain-containing protein [Planctomycetaceae bacterium]MDG1809492.1 DUF1501 domain-containing protein [Pirellulaceae bacterium]MDG2104550.1 DUF1501 domain-containing protein [Pirellulaceae bacterium]